MPSRLPREPPQRLSSIASWGITYLKNRLRIDTRTLALFRISAALIIITEVLLRARNFTFFYTDEGVVPRDFAMERTVDYAFSLYFLTNDTRVVALLFVLHILVALQLLVGYKTRVAIVLSFLFVVSLDYRNPFINSYADTLFRLLLFWAMFLPLGERWSIDALLRDRAPKDAFLGFASALILAQMSYMYVRNGIHKLEGDQWLDGTAAPLILSRDDITFFLGEYAHHVAPLLEYGTYLWTAMMVFGFVLILAPGRLRYPLIVLYMGGHFSFAVTVRIGMFPYVAMAGLLLFIPAVFWDDLDRLSKRVGSALERKTGLTLSRTAMRERFRPVQDRLRRLPRLDIGYQDVRAGVYTFGIYLVVVTIVLVLALSGLQYVGAVSEDANYDAEVHQVANSFNIDQPDFSIFAPNPGTNDRYFVIPAETENGDVIDIYNDRENATLDRPGDQLQVQYEGYRERFFMNSIRGASTNDTLPDRYAEWLCETETGPDGEPIKRMDIWVITEEVTMDSLNDPDEREQSRRISHRYACGDHEEAPVSTA